MAPAAGTGDPAPGAGEAPVQSGNGADARPETPPAAGDPAQPAAGGVAPPGAARADAGSAIAGTVQPPENAAGAAKVEAGASAEPHDYEHATLGERWEQLRRSMEDANVLVWYAGRKGVAVDFEVMKELIGAQDAYRRRAWTVDKEAAFWVNFQKLSAAVRPATVESIRATAMFNGNSKTQARLQAKRYTIGTMLALAVLLVIQIYWFVGHAISSDIRTMKEQSAEILNTHAAKDGEAKAVSVLIGEKNRELRTLQPETEDHAELVVELGQLEKSYAVYQGEREALLKDHEESKRMLAAAFVWLQRWDLTDNFGFQGAAPIVVDTPREGKAVPAGGVISNEMALLAGKSVLTILTQYILPLCYGLLGSLAHILRTLNNEIQQMTFTPGRTRFLLRWPLGMLAGITIGWFFDPEKLTGIVAITPLALAFLAGYSVEILFSALDRIVGAFTDQDEARTARPAA